MHFDTWPVAAAVILLHPSEELHYNAIARLVKQTGLTTLGMKGRTPDQTMGSLLRQHSEVFRGSRTYRGLYGLRDAIAAAEIPDVASAVKAIKNKQQAASELEALRKEIKTLQDRNSELEDTIKRIAALCNGRKKR